MKRPMEFNIRIAATEKAGFKASAEAAGMTLSAWTRDRLRTAAARELRRVGNPSARQEAIDYAPHVALVTPSR
jgi:hypothetical protein